MKIAFSGTQCVGKTTFLEIIKKELESNKSLLSNILKDYTIGKSGTHNVINQGLPSSELSNDITQLLILSNYVYDLNKINHISDRCILDNLIYTEYQHTKGKCSEELLKLTTKLVDKYINRYNYIFLLPPEVPVINNGIRSIDEVYRTTIHVLFLNKIKKFNNIYLLPGNFEEKLNLFTNIIKTNAN